MKAWVAVVEEVVGGWEEEGRVEIWGSHWEEVVDDIVDEFV